MQRILYDASPCGIEMDVQRRRQEIAVIKANSLSVWPTKQVASPFIFSVESHGISGKEVAHGGIQVLFSRPKEQVNMIGHETESINNLRVLLCDFLEKLQHEQTVIVHYEERFFTRGPLGDVRDEIRDVEFSRRPEVSVDLALSD